MAKLLNSESLNFQSELDSLLEKKESGSKKIDSIVQEILNNVKTNGDIALKFYNKKYDNFVSNVSKLRVTQEEFIDAKKLISLDLSQALILAKKRIEEFQKKQLPSDIMYKDDLGMDLGVKWSSIKSVGIYVPGGTASYPSSVLMNAIPGKVAGVNRIVMTVPAPNGKISPAVLYAAELSGVDEVYKVGGAQAIGALAYGTKEIDAVDKIVGPGNSYVASAKKYVYGKVGIDMLAGPSEVLIIADSLSNPSWIAADILAQAEHDINAQSILICENIEFADKVMEAIKAHLNLLSRSVIAEESWDNNGIIIINPELKNVDKIVDKIAPEHIELSLSKPSKYLENFRNAGAVFLGRYTPEAIGDYIAGPSHVLPTSGNARFESGLSVIDFMKRSSLIGCDRDVLSKIGKSAVTLAEAEGLSAHALSINLRILGNN